MCVELRGLYLEEYFFQKRKEKGKRLGVLINAINYWLYNCSNKLSIVNSVIVTCSIAVLMSYIITPTNNLFNGLCNIDN